MISLHGTMGAMVGSLLVEYAERALACDKFYVCAYGPAEKFWQKCGYRDTREIGGNGLKIFEKI